MSKAARSRRVAPAPASIACLTPATLWAGKSVHDEPDHPVGVGTRTCSSIGKEGHRPHSSAVQEHRRGRRSSRRRPAVKAWSVGPRHGNVGHASSGHAGGPFWSRRSVDEHQPAGIEIGLALEPGPAARGDVRALLLGGVRGFFLKLIPWRSKNRHTVRSRPTGRAQFQQRLQLSVMSGVSSTLGKNSAAPSIRPDRRSPPLAGAARPAPHINPTYGTRHADAEPCRRTTT